jgi:hypothetical protein
MLRAERHHRINLFDKAVWNVIMEEITAEANGNLARLPDLYRLG